MSDYPPMAPFCGVVRAATLDTLLTVVVEKITELRREDNRTEVISISHAADPELEEWSAFITCQRPMKFAGYRYTKATE